MNRPSMIEMLKRGIAPIAVAVSFAAVGSLAMAQSDRTLRIGDYIVAVVNSELVTANEVEQRSGRVRDEARRGGSKT